MRQRLDPRLWQIGALTALLMYGVFVLRFEVTLLRAALIVGAAVATQRIFSKDVLSAVISGLSPASIVFWSATVIGRSLGLGEPMTIPMHRLENGALLLFTFFMISDPRTTPDARAGRILFAALVALGAGYIQFRLFRTNGILWSLAITSFFTPVIDLLFQAERFVWNRQGDTPCEPSSLSFSS